MDQKPMDRKQFCCYCGQEFTVADHEVNDVFSYAGVYFHGHCRSEALQNAIRSCQKEINLVKKK